MAIKPQARVFEKTVNCPVCAQPFKARVMRHHLFRKIFEDSDFCPYYEGSNPLLESVWLCPSCHYCSAPKDFFDLSMEDKDAIARYSLAVLKDIEVPSRVRNLEDAILNLQLACHCYERRPSKVAQQGAHYLKTAWCYRYGKDKEKENEFLRLALIRYRRVFEETHRFPQGLGEIGTAYLVGDLLRRLGQLESSRKWLVLVLNGYPEISSQHWIKRLARDRMEDIREAISPWETLQQTPGVTSAPLAAAPSAKREPSPPEPVAAREEELPPPPIDLTEAMGEGA